MMYHNNNRAAMKQMDRLKLRQQLEFFVPRVYAAIACELWDLGFTEEMIQYVFAMSQERWRDSVANGWDMLENVEEVTGIKVKYFRETGNIV